METSQLADRPFPRLRPRRRARLFGGDPRRRAHRRPLGGLGAVRDEPQIGAMRAAQPHPLGLAGRGGELRQRLVGLGLIFRGRGHDRFLSEERNQCLSRT